MFSVFSSAERAEMSEPSEDLHGCLDIEIDMFEYSANVFAHRVIRE